MHPPSFLFVELNQQCNLHCKHCFYWTRDEVVLPGHISIARRAEIIGEFHALNRRGTVVICGGESTMNPDRFWAVTTQCRELDLKCFCVTNGTSVVNLGEASKMIAEGPTEITISMNSHLADAHDKSRGKGSFKAAVKAVELLLGARALMGRDTPINVMAVVSEENYRELDEFYSFVLYELTADKLKLNILQPSFGAEAVAAVKDKFFAANLVKDVNELMAIIDVCDKKHNLNLNPEWKRVVRHYHESFHTRGDAENGWKSKGTFEPICNSYERNIMLDMFGKARLCFSHNFPATQLRKIGDLATFWETNDALRARMATCTAPCGISHSVRRANATNRGVTDGG